jgi:hypothetical protein
MTDDFSSHLIFRTQLQIVRILLPVDWNRAAPSFNLFAQRVTNAVAGWESEFDDVFGAGSSTDSAFVEEVRATLTPNIFDIYDDAHWRLFAQVDGDLSVVCVQDFDYRDYEQWRFVGERRFATEADAEAAVTFLRERISGLS